MSENENVPAENASEEESSTGASEGATQAEEISYHAVEKDGKITAIWEMQGRRHLRTIDPRSRLGQEILKLYTAEHHDEQNAQAVSE